MAIQASGIGSGLDINGLVTSLVQAERQPVEARLATQETRIQAQLSATATLQSALTGFRASAVTLLAPATYQARSATSSKPELFSATADGTAALGNYSVKVVSLASSQKLASQGYASDDTEVGTGTLTFTSGDREFAVTVSQTGDSLAQIRNAINSANDNDFVLATIINTDAGRRLVLTSKQTGVDNAFTVVASGGNGGLEDLENANMEVIAAAADAEVEIEGFTLFSATNTISGAIQGVTLKLLEADPLATAAVTVAQNTATQLGAVKGFISAWNTLNTTMTSLGKVNGGQASVLTGDALLRGVSAQLRRVLSTPAGGLDDPFSTLSELGITMQLDGSLKLDEAKLNDALATNENAVSLAFRGPQGFATRMDATIGGMLGTAGTLASRTEGLSDRLKNISRQREALSLRMESIERRYRAQFSALDSLVGQLRSTSNFLTQQLESLNNSRR